MEEQTDKILNRKMIMFMVCYQKSIKPGPLFNVESDALRSHKPDTFLLLESILSIR